MFCLGDIVWKRNNVPFIVNLVKMYVCIIVAPSLDQTIKTN